MNGWIGRTRLFFIRTLSVMLAFMLIFGNLFGQPAFADESEAVKDADDSQTSGQGKPIQELLISEIVPATDSFDTGHDVYEYVKLYNPTDRAISLNDYEVRLRYVGGKNGPWNDKHWNFPSSDLVIKPHDIFIVWIANPGNSGDNNKSVADFNHYWGTDFVENQNIVKMGSGLTNHDRGIVIATKSGRAVCEAYLTDSGSEIYKKGFTYAQTANHDLKLALNLEEGKTQPTTPASPSEKPTNFENVDVGGDQLKPVIDHRQTVTQFKSGDSFTVDAKVADDSFVSHVNIYYRFDDEQTWHSKTMVQTYEDPASSYSADFADSDISGQKTMDYYIEASDGKNESKTQSYRIAIDKSFPKLTEVQELLVSEIVPATDNEGTVHDVYEYVEIYNPTDRKISLDDYVMRYRYVDDGQGPWSDKYWDFPVSNLYLEPNQVLVCWINNPANTKKTVQDFNNYWHTNLVENQSIVRMGTGLSNHNRGIALATKSGRGVSEALLTDSGDGIYDKAFTYRQVPNNGLELQLILSGNNTLPTAKPTPGVAPTNFQRLYIADDQVAPDIQHEQPKTSVGPGEDYKITADITDNHFVSSVAAYYRFDGEGAFKKLETSKLYESYTSTYPFNWYAPELLGKKKLEYYLVASDGKNEKKSETFTVDIQSHSFDGLRTNIENGQTVSGTVPVQATDEAERLDSIKLSIDDEEIKADELKRVLEWDPFFVANVNQMNYNFKNALIVDNQVVHALDEDSSRHILTRPIDRSYFSDAGSTTAIRISSGTLSSFMDYDNPKENRDDFDLRDVSLLLEDGTEIKPEMLVPKDKTSQAYQDGKDFYIGDGSKSDKYVDFVFKIPADKFNTKAFELDTKKLADGEHQLTISSSSGEKKVTFTVDNTAPDIQSNLQKEPYKGAFTLHPVAKDDHSGIKSTEVALDGKPIDLPYETSSAELSAGKHELSVTAIDDQGNKAEKTFEFQTVVEQPGLSDFDEKVVKTNDGLSADLSLKATDETNDPLSVQFFKGYQYKAGDEQVTVSENASETEPPEVFRHPDEKTLDDSKVSSMAEQDGEMVTTESTDKFPYHRFDIKVDPSVKPDDKIEIKWSGKSLPGRKVTIYAYNHELEKWAPVTSELYQDKPLTLTGEVTAGPFVNDSTVSVIVQDEVSGGDKVQHDLFKGIDTIDYTFGVMPDTQFYSKSYPEIYNMTSQWFVDNRDALNLKYIFHLGDIVDNFDQPYQWENATAAMKRLDEAGVPYGIMTGNHDVGQGNDYTSFYKYFGESRYEKNPWYGGSYKNNRGHYDLIEANGNEYIMLSMGWGIGEEEVAWMNQVLKEHENRTAILFVHDYLNEGSTRTTQGEMLYEKVVKPNKNVRMVMNGHIHGAAQRIDQLDDNQDGKADREVVQILVDYQSHNGGQGYIRVMGLDMTNNKVYVRTYSPYTEGTWLFSEEQDNFDFDFDLTAQPKMIATDAFEANVYTNQTIGEKVKVGSGETAKIRMSGLTEHAGYGWYAVATDEYGGNMRSGIHMFTADHPVDETDPGDGETPGDNTPPGDEQGNGDGTDVPGEDVPGNDGGTHTPGGDASDQGDGSGDRSDPDTDGGNHSDGDRQEDRDDHSGNRHDEGTKNEADSDSPKHASLPGTASTMYNWLALGLMTVLLGAGGLVYRNRRRRLNETDQK